MIKQIKILILLPAFMLLLAAGTAAAELQVNVYSINSGGGEMSGGDYRMSSSVGQTAAGFEVGKDLLHWVGFWSPEIPELKGVRRLQDAKLLPDGSFVNISGKAATSGETDFSGFFYLEETDRSSGIKISVPAWPVHGLQEGSLVNVIGTLGTSYSGEREMTAPIVVIVSSTKPLRPLGMSNIAVGGSDYITPGRGIGLNNIGLLVSTWGLVTASASGYVMIDDGSGTPVRVDLSRLSVLPVVGDYISVTGISSLYRSGDQTLRSVLPRRDSDIVGY